jgi:ankyrin repeat protein
MASAAEYGHKHIVELLLKAGATDYNRAISVAEENGCGEVVDLIKRWRARNS